MQKEKIKAPEALKVGMAILADTTHQMFITIL